ncbi:MAG: hypothetical protein ABJC60_09460 [Actinomycetota bacterium]
MTTERLRGLSDEELGRTIRASGPAWPTTPSLASIVTERIGETERFPQLRPRLSLPSRRRTVLILIAATLLLAAAAVAAGLVVRIGAETVTVVPGAKPTLPGDVLSREVLGRAASSPAEAASRAGFDVVVPTRLGEPAGVWTGPTPPDAYGSAPVTRVVLAWPATPALPTIRGLPWGAVLMEFPGEANLAAKTIFEEGGGIQDVTVEGRQGLWVTGEHTITLAAADDRAPVELRVTGNVLLWQRGDLTLRLETSLGLPAALDVAASVP